MLYPSSSAARLPHPAYYNKDITYIRPSMLHGQIQLPLKSPNQLVGTPILKQTIKHISIRRNKSASSNILRLMDGLNLPTQPDMYASLIKECTFSRDSISALDLHHHLNQSGFRLTLPMINRLLLMYVSCGQLDIACSLFDQMTVKKDFHTWAIIIVGYLSHARYEDSICLFIKMLHSSSNNQLSEFPAWVIVAILKACLYTLNMGLGKQLHGLSLKLGSSNNLSVGGSLINFYGKFRCLEDANLVFDQLLHRNTVIWIIKIMNNCRQGHFIEVIDDFMKMGRAGVRWNSFTFSTVLRACARVDDGGNCGRQVHVNAIKVGLESDDVILCGLIDMYGKCGMFRDAKRVFEMITDKRNGAYWNVMLMVYVHNGFYIEAFKFLYQMQVAGVKVPQSLINKVRIACGTGVSETRTEQTG